MRYKIFGAGVVVKRLLLALFFLASPTLHSKYELTEEDLTARKEIINSISEPGPMQRVFASGLNAISSLTPDFAKCGLASCASYVAKKTLGNYSLRNELRYLAFGADNAVFTQYDFILSPQEIIPKQPVSHEVLNKLLESAKNERQDWHNGKMSGGIYDGSVEHMETLSRFFKSALERDKHNRGLFAKDRTRELATKAFAYFQTVNPLHGNLFPLAVKSMRELGSMFASLLGRQHAIVSSGGEEALRIALRTLKNRHRVNDEQCLIYTMGDSKNFIENIAHTLNIQITKDPHQKKEAHFAVVYVTKDNLDTLIPIGKYFSQRGLDLHIHLDNDVFRRLFLDHDLYDLKKVFERFSSTKSVSFDTEGLFYQGISATVFSDAERRFDAFEAHIDWSGGIYPGINTAGSLPGIDYIIAYLLTLLNSKSSLAALAKEARPVALSSPLIEERYQDFKKEIIDQFEKSPTGDEGDIFLEEMHRNFLPSDWQKLMENLLIDTTLNIFGGSSKDFSGQITSGGTESIRLAIQTYFHRFKKLYPQKTPIFLMTEKAHIAFDRHIKDLDCRIIRIKERNNTMDLDDLQQQIENVGSLNIAAIIASTPNYPIGTSDYIGDIAVIALRNGVPLHVDACLGGFIMQFLENNPVAINLRDPIFDGITSWSADIHKYGVTQKGLSFVGLRKRNDLEMPTSICKKRSSTQLEIALLCMLKIGRKGYEARAQSIVDLAKELKEHLLKINGLEIIATPSGDVIPPHFVIGFRLKEPYKHLTYTLGRFMSKLGWHLSAVGHYTLHIAITNAHTYNKDFLPKFVSDMEFVVDTIKRFPNMKQSSSVGLYGMAAAPRGLSLVTDSLKDQFLAGMLRLYAENLVE